MAKIAFKKNNDLPLGSIVAWGKGLNGGPSTLPPGWVECNGQAIPGGHKLTGTAPALNGTLANNRRHLRGSQVDIGDFYGNYTHGHTFSTYNWSGIVFDNDFATWVNNQSSIVLQQELALIAENDIYPAEHCPPSMNVCFIYKVS